MIRDILGIAVLIFAREITASAASEGSLEQREQTFVIRLDAAVQQVAPLFGPVREAEWAPGWSPNFLHPSAPAQSAGAIFKTFTPNRPERIWLLTRYNEQEGDVQYVVFTRRSIIDQITIKIAPDGQQASRATITYRRSAVLIDGNREVEKLDSAWSHHQQIHWE